MNFKVVRDVMGTILGFGPNVDEYEPFVPEGAQLSIEQAQPILPVIPPVSTSPIDKLKAFLTANPDVEALLK